MTLSAPKSVSLVWGLGDDETARTVVESHERAVDVAITYLERHACVVRRGHAGARTAKSEHVPEEELRRRWSERAEPFGIAIDRLPALVRSPVIDQTDDEIAARVTEASATFERRDVVRVIAQAATQGAALEEIEARADAFLTSEQAVIVSVDRWTTPEMLAMERRTVDVTVASVPLALWSVRTSSRRPSLPGHRSAFTRPAPSARSPDPVTRSA